MSRLLCVTLLAVSLASAKPLSTYHGTPREAASITFAPLHVDEHPHGTVNGSYIVMLKDGVEPTLMANHMNFLQNVHAVDPDADAFAGLTHVYDAHVKGYAGRFSDFVVDHIRSMPEVDYVERDQIVRTLEVERHDELEEGKVSTQNGAPWVSHAILDVCAGGVLADLTRRPLVRALCVYGNSGSSYILPDGVACWPSLTLSRRECSHPEPVNADYRRLGSCAY